MPAKWSNSEITVGFGAIVFSGSKRSSEPGGPEYLSFGVRAFQEKLQCGAIEFPIKWAWLTIAELLVQKKPLPNFFQAREVIRARSTSVVAHPGPLQITRACQTHLALHS